MNRYNSNENSLDGNNNYSKTEIICMRLRVLMYCLFVLVLIRIATFEFLWMITDILSCVILYCTYSSKGRVMALFCLINGMFSGLYAIIFSIVALNNPRKSKNQYAEYSTNSKIDTISAENSISGTPTFTLYPALIVIGMIWALVIYSLIAYYSYEGFEHFENPNEDGRLLRKQREPNNYGAVNPIIPVNQSDNNQGVYSGQSSRNNSNNNAGNRFVAFSGRGTVLGA